MTDAERELLDRLEQQEARLLCWGISAVQHTRDELHAACEEAGVDDPARAHEAIEGLLEQRLLLRFDVDGRGAYRTRTAETVRLMEHLRQMFQPGQWESGPRLVSGYRYHLGVRRAPRRDIPSVKALSDLSEVCPQGGVRARAVRTMLGDRSLSSFQFDATRAVFSAVDSTDDRGVMITAGTGAGKTLAFYLPSLALLADRTLRSEDKSADLIAIYPRQELLKDQMSTAVGELERLAPLWKKLGRRPRIGALYGDAPLDVRYLESDRRAKWQRRGGYFICPFVRAPSGNAMGLSLQDAQAGRERLVELREDGAPGLELGPDEIVISRLRMFREPPDLLVCTTEMVNRGLCDSSLRELIAGRGGPAKKLVLLDEVHLYEGMSGAQTALTLRRWRHAVGPRASVAYVGLSATLLEAERFFATLTGVSDHRVEPVAPKREHLDPIGSNYSLVLRGDPYSRAQLLSTSLQAAMLMGRMLDPPGGPSNGVFPRKTFVFTDDLDVTQRFLSDLKDAEKGGPYRIRMPLAALRSSESIQVDKAKRLVDGQYWLASERIGHPLDKRLEIDEVSSRDRGFNPRADIVIATASLEVGFDDDEVGAVLQHKAPRSSSSFIQRIGRAGRLVQARPWSVVVLSDYGRDRMAYQAFEELFEPTLAPPGIPLRNRYVLGMQAAYAAMDWLTIRAVQRGARAGSVWRDLASPATLTGSGSERKQKQRAYAQERQAHLRDILEDVLRDRHGERADLVRYIRDALGLGHEEALRLCWEHPRPIIGEVIPTARRRLIAQWACSSVGGSTSPLEEFGHDPLPEFVPGNLFSSLNLPEVQFEFPDDRDPKVMPIEQALRAFAPGRVNKRFTHGGGHSLWTFGSDSAALQALVDGTDNLDLDVRSISSQFDQLGHYEYRDERGGVARAQVVRPRSIQLRPTPRTVREHPTGITVGDTTNARLRWHTQLDAREPGVTFPIPWPRPGWKLLDDVRFQTHGEHCPIDVRRFATESRIAFRLKAGGEMVRGEASLRLVIGSDSQPAAVGFTLRADAARFRFHYPEELPEAATDDDLVPSTRLAYLTHRWLDDKDLPSSVGRFMRERLLEVALNAVSARALKFDEALAAAADDILRSDARWREAAERVLRVLLESTAHGNEADDTRVALAEPGVRERLAALMPILWRNPSEDDPDGFDRWLRDRYRSTLGHAVLEATRLLCREFEEGDLILDLDGGLPIFAGEESGGADSVGIFWLVESTPGGAGAIDALASAIAADPRRFSLLVDSALGQGDWEVVDVEMRRLLRLVEVESDVQEVVDAYREATGFEEMEEATDAMQRTLSLHGVRMTDALRATMFARWLRPGSTQSVDNLLRAILAAGDAWEQRLRIELDPRVLSYLVAADDELAPLFAGLGPGGDEAWRRGQVLSLLWPRGMVVRTESLRSYSPFADLPPPDRLLVTNFAPLESVVRLDDEGWESAFGETLRLHGHVSLSEGRAGRKRLADVCAELLCTPIMLGALRVFPRLVGVTEEDGDLRAEFDLVEVGP